MENIKNKCDLTGQLTRELERRLQIFSAATGVNAVWKIGASLCVHTGIDERHRMHLCDFCTLAKRLIPEGEEHCIHHDTVLVRQAILHCQEPFRQRCHAHAEELVIPMIHQGRYAGTLLLGPFRTEEEEFFDSAPESLKRAYRKLEVLQESRERGLSALARELFQQIADRLDEHAGAYLIPQISETADVRVGQALQFLKKNFRRPIPVPELAQWCGVSLPHLEHLFKTAAGVSVREYSQRLRMVEAEKLLIHTRMTLAEIALHCGLADQSRLNLLFQRYFNLSPGKYRTKFTR